MRFLDQSKAQSLTWGSVVARTYGLYWTQRGKLFLIALIPAALVYIWQMVYQFSFDQLRLHGWIDFGAPLQTPLLVLSGFVDGAVYTLLACFCFAAIAAKVLSQAEGEDVAVPGALPRPQTRFGAVAAAGMVFWILFWLGRTVAAFAALHLLTRFRMFEDWAFSAAMILPFLTLVLVLSRLGLAIPSLMDQPAVSLTQALKKSLIRTENWEFFITLFVVKLAVLGAGLYWFADAVVDQIWNHSVLYGGTQPWAMRLLHTLILAVTVTPLFVALSVLYRDWRPKANHPMTTPHP